MITEGAESGLTEEIWASLRDAAGAVHARDEVQRLVYCGGVQQNIRREVWPYLLGYYEFVLYYTCGRHFV